jgi:5-methyltetrahydropteroyltriglutamate--homocysteine methyltransferase
LRRATHDCDNGKITQEQFAKIEDEVTSEVIKEQDNAGIDIVSDGGIRWHDQFSYFAGKLQGVEITGLVRYFDTNTLYRQPVVKSEIQWTKPVMVSDFEFAKTCTSKPVKVILPGPVTLAANSVDKHYNNQANLIDAYAKTLTQEVAALFKAGCPLVQIDEPSLVYDSEIVSLDVCKRALSEIVEPRTSDAGKLALYTYFGSPVGIYDFLLGLPYDIIGLDFTYAPECMELIEKKQPKASLAAGIIDARNTKMEGDEVGQKLRKIANIVGADNLYVNPNCGLEFLPRSIARKKLEKMVTMTRNASGGA